jgi:ElaB/YqjD/DUF883 family membrane-anchored ribosome-binding protein
VADSLEQGGQYLQTHTPADMMNDVTECIRKNPWTSVMIGAAAGFLLARLMRR